MELKKSELPKDYPPAFVSFIKMLSPLIVRQHENGINKYLAYNDENFTRCFKMSVNKMLESFGLNSTGEIEIQPIKPKKTVVNTFGNKITGNIGAFLLKAEPETLNHLYKLGVGSRRSQGFSMFEIAVKAAQS